MSILISYDENAYKICIRDLDSATPVLQSAVNEFLKLSIGNLKPSEFGAIFSDPVGLVFDKVTGGSLKIGNLSIKKDRAMELIDLPPGYSRFLKNVQDGINFLATKRTPDNYTIPANEVKKWYVMNDNHEVGMNNETIENHKKCFQKFLHNDAGKKMYEFAKSIVEKYDGLGISDITHKRSMGDIVASILDRNDATGHTFRIDNLIKYDDGRY